MHFTKYSTKYQYKLVCAALNGLLYKSSRDVNIYERLKLLFLVKRYAWNLVKLDIDEITFFNIFVEFNWPNYQFLGGLVFRKRAFSSISDLIIQWNLSIADMLYSGHLSIADTFLKNGWTHGQSLIEKPLYSGQK